MTVSPALPDIFEILDVEEREDTYSRLLVHLLEHSASLRKKVLAHAFVANPPPEAESRVRLRHRFDDGRVVDIFIRDRADPPTWAIFIESKLYTGEHGDQTIDYLASTRNLVGASGKASGIFLTIGGYPARAPEVRSLTHRELTGWIEEILPELREHPALALAAEAYAKRARVPLVERAADDTRVRDLLTAPRWGLVPHLASVAALGAGLCHGLDGEWKPEAIWIQGKGHANPGLQFWRPGWCGREVVEPDWTPDNIYVHLEVELTDAPWWRLKVHFETEPYYTQNQLRELKGHEGFATMRDAFRAGLHAQKANFPQWKPTHHRLQSAMIDVPVGPDATVAELRAHFAPAMTAIAPCINRALAQARATMAPTKKPTQPA